MLNLRFILILLSIKFIYTYNDFESKFCECKTFNSSILNDSIANEQDLKFMATIEYLMPKNESDLSEGYFILNICSGVIMNSFAILTTAHCLNFIREINNLTNFRITAGSHDLEKVYNIEDYNRMIENFSYISSNHENKFESIEYNLGLIRLDKPFKLGANILAACFQNFLQDNLSDLYLAGYGSDQNNDIEQQQNKTKIFLKIYKNQIIDPLLNFSVFDDFLPASSNLKINIFKKSFKNTYPCDGENLICAFSVSNKSNECLGDEGSPLLYVHNNKLYILGLLTDILYKSAGECLNNSTKLFISVYPYLNQNNFTQLISSEYCLDKNLINLANISATTTIHNLSNKTTDHHIELTTKVVTSSITKLITDSITTNTYINTTLDLKTTPTTKLTDDKKTTNTLINTTLDSKTKPTTKLTDDKTTIYFKPTTTYFKPTTKIVYSTTQRKTKSTSKLSTNDQSLIQNTTETTKNTFSNSTSKSDLIKNIQIKEYIFFVFIVLLILLLILILWCSCYRQKNPPIDNNKSLINVISFDTKSRSDNKIVKKSSIIDKASLMSLKSINEKSKSDSKLKKKSKIGSTKKTKSSDLKSESLKSIGIKSLNSKSISVTLPSVQSVGVKSVVSMSENVKLKKK